MRKSRLQSERGAMMVHVALIFIVVMAFSMLVVDYGVMWVSRNQAQNAADSGALAGAVSLALDSFTDHSNTGPAKTAARSFALNTAVFGESADVQNTDITFYTDAPSRFPADCSDDSCVRVDVFRNQDRSNPLPMFFGMFVGLNEQGVRATATAQAAMANASDCLKPWAVADKWVEHYPVDTGADPLPTDTFDPDPPGGVPGDVYIPPGQPNSTSFTVPDDIGMQVRLKTGSPGDSINPGWFMPLDFGPEYCPPGANNPGGSCYRESISGCSTRLWAIGDQIPKENGNMIGPTKQGTGDLIAKDPHAYWGTDPETGNQRVLDSCVEDNSCVDPDTGAHVEYSESPRIVAIPIFDITVYLASEKVNGQGDIVVTNILGFFVEEMNGNDVIGRLMKTIEQVKGGAGNVDPTSSFIKVIRLVR